MFKQTLKLKKKSLKVKSSKLFAFLFLLGLICLAIAGLSLFAGLNPALLKPTIQYEIGHITSFKGKAEKATFPSGRERLLKKQKVYSKERFILGRRASITFKLSGESITVFGPADLNLEVISPETKKVFINFSKFEEVRPKENFSNLTLTYKGWLIEPYFEKEDLNSSSSRSIKASTISHGEDSSHKSPREKNFLNELIASKRSLLKRCYENYLRKNPMATGKLVVEFTLQNSGRVSSSRVKDSSFFKDESFKNCLQDVFRRIKTKPFEGDAIPVTYPIEFE